MASERTEPTNLHPNSTTPPGHAPRQSRIHFPADSELNRLPASTVRRQAFPRDTRGDRQRVWSVDITSPSVSKRGHALSQLSAGLDHLSSSRARSVSYPAKKSGVHGHGPSVEDEGSVGTSFNDDGSDLLLDSGGPEQIDPNILADVQRALKYKSKVEERLKAAQSKQSLGASHSSPHTPSSSFSAESSSPFLIRPFAGPVTSGLSERLAQAELVDFSPSVRAAPLHPVPLSSNDGATLDWSVAHLEEDRRERKWSMPLSRRVTKERSPPRRTATAGVVEKQESLYADKLLRIRTKATPQTLRKAEITRDQLQRRYAAMYSPPFFRDIPVNLAATTRWLSQQDDLIRRLLDEAEPLSWLRHLLQKPGVIPHSRLPWHLSALIVEEYIRSQSEEDAMSSLRENFSETDIVDFASTTNGHRPSSSRPTSFRSVDAIVPKRRRSDDLISFEPLTQSRRNSVGHESSRSIENQKRSWRNFPPGMLDSPRSSARESVPIGAEYQARPLRNSLPAKVGSPKSSAPGSISNAVTSKHGSASPVSSRIRHRGFGKRLRRLSDRSDEGSSSAFDSLSEGPKSPDGLTAFNDKRSTQLSPSLESNHETEDSGLGSKGNKLKSEMKPFVDDPAQHLVTPRPANNFPLPILTGGDIPESQSPPKQEAAQLEHLKSTQQEFSKRRIRASRPSSLYAYIEDVDIESPITDAHKRTREAEYERKKETLDTLKAQNASTKLLLQAASKSIQDFEELRREFSEILGTSYERISPEVLEALSHDPTAVPGTIRRLSGWRAVEDVYQRQVRQKEVLQAFVTSLPAAVSAFSMTERERTLCQERTLDSLALVNQLCDQRQQVLDFVQEANSLLLHVTELRDQVKPEFDAAEKHTCANYPELIRLESLLDRFAVKRNHLRTLGETLLSLVLSSSAPFMKTFGRPIWDDVHDFLVIPWYRNDFSGEPLWYPVKFPKRHATHWLKLAVFCIGTPFVLATTLHSLIILFSERRLISMPYLVPWLLMYMVFSLLILVLVITVIALLLTVLGECATLLWWAAWVMGLVK